MTSTQRCPNTAWMHSLRYSVSRGGAFSGALLTAAVAQTDFLQSVFQFVPAMIAASDWRLWAAALEAVGVVSLATKDVCAEYHAGWLHTDPLSGGWRQA